MVQNLTHAEIVAELARLRKQRMESLANATFVGWTREEMAVEEGRLERIRALLRMLEA